VATTNRKSVVKSGIDASRQIACPCPNRPGQKALSDYTYYPER